MLLNTREHGYHDAIRGYRSICDRSPAYRAGYEEGRWVKARERIIVNMVSLACIVVATSALVIISLSHS